MPERRRQPCAPLSSDLVLERSSRGSAKVQVGERFAPPEHCRQDQGLHISDFLAAKVQADE